MHRMHGVDAQFVYAERRNEPQHTIKLAILDSPSGADFTIDDARSLVRDRLSVLDPLRWRIVRSPLDLGHPECLDLGGEVDLDYHVRETAIPAPGGHAELCRTIGDLASSSLRMDRPLWELWFLRGGGDGSIAALLKLHHSLADGGASRVLIERLFSPLPEGGHPTLGGAESPPRGRSLAGSALRDLGADMRRTPSLVRVAAAAARRRRELPPTEADHVTSLLSSPSAPFIEPVSDRRSFDFVHLDLATAKRTARDLGCTINDLVVATAAGAARRWLGARGDLADAPYSAGVAFSTREPGWDWGNQITTDFIPLASHLPDAADRLRASCGAMTAAKHRFDATRGGQKEDLIRELPAPLTHPVSLLSRQLFRRRTDLAFGFIISNVRGPAAHLATDGWSVRELVSVGHIPFVSTINLTVWSYDGRLSFGLFTCPDGVPDLTDLTAGLSPAFDELAALGSSTPRPA